MTTKQPKRSRARVVRLDETKTVMAASRPTHPACKESTAKGALKAFKVIVDNFTPPGYTRRKSPNDQAEA